MNKTSIFFLSLCAALLMSACSWVDDDLSKCPKGNWLKLSYTYNLLDVDAVATQVENVTLFVYKHDGTLVHREEVDSVNLHGNGCKIRIPDLPEGDYDFLVWGGLDDSNYKYTPDSVELLCNEHNENSAKLKSLFHGRLDNIHITDDYNVYELYLSKLTNVFSCMFQSESDSLLAIQNDLRVEIASKNSCIDHRNNIIGDKQIYYLPFMKETSTIEDLDVFHVGLNTLRLMEKDNTRFRLIYVPTGQKIIDIPLTDYILFSRHVDYASMPPQEYLDREDHYNLIFLLTESVKPEDPPLICAQVNINGWIVRYEDVDLEHSGN